MKLPKHNDPSNLFQGDDSHVASEWTQDSIEHPKQLADPHPKSRQRLGHYYEDLVSDYLTSTRHITDIKRNIQVFDEKRTVGEYDFIVTHQDNQTTHLECAIKFYLCTGDGSELSQYVGPNRKDRLDKKWHALTERQIQLSDTAAGKQALTKLGLHSQPNKQILIQGMLFYPYLQPVPTAFAADINPKHLKGWWIKQKDYSALVTGNNALALIVREKPDWLVSYQGPVGDGWQTQIESATKPVMVSRIEKHLASGGWKEVDRGFIVPNDWDKEH